MIEVQKEEFSTLPDLIRTLGRAGGNSSCSLMTLAFDQDDRTYSVLKTILEGGLERRPTNVGHLCHLQPPPSGPSDLQRPGGDEVDASETIQEKTSLAEALWSAHPHLAMGKKEYLEMVDRMAAYYGVEMEQETLHARRPSSGRCTIRAARPGWSASYCQPAGLIRHKKEQQICCSFCFCGVGKRKSAQGNVKDHHDQKAAQHAEGSQIGVLAQVGLGISSSTTTQTMAPAAKGERSQGIRGPIWGQLVRSGYQRWAPTIPGEAAAEKGLPAGHSLPPAGEWRWLHPRGSFWIPIPMPRAIAEVYSAPPRRAARGQGQRRRPTAIPSECCAGLRQRQEVWSASRLLVIPLRLFGIWMEVGKQAVQHEEKQGQQKTARSGQVSGDPGRLCLFDRGDEQGPDRGSNHNARRKP